MEGIFEIIECVWKKEMFTLKTSENSELHENEKNPITTTERRSCEHFGAFPSCLPVWVHLFNTFKIKIGMILYPFLF